MKRDRVHRVFTRCEAGPGPDLQPEEAHHSKGQAGRQDQTCLGTAEGSGDGGQAVGLISFGRCLCPSLGTGGLNLHNTKEFKEFFQQK